MLLETVSLERDSLGVELSLLIFFKNDEFHHSIQRKREGGGGSKLMERTTPSFQRTSSCEVQ